MPKFNFLCKQCNASFAKILKVEAVDDFLLQPHSCGGMVERNPVGASSRVVETIDNTWMPKAVERLADVENLRREWIRETERKKNE